MDLRIILTGAGVFFILLSIWGVIYMWSRNRLARIMNLELEFSPSVGIPGKQVDFILAGQPERTVKTVTVEGDLTCFQYNAFWMQAFDDMQLPGLTTGRMITSVVFSMGRDMVFMGGVRSTFDGYLPIPPDSPVTENSGPILCRWVATVRVHAMGYLPAVVRRELPVREEEKSAIKNWNTYPKIEQKTVETFTGSERRRDNIIVVMEGEPSDGAGTVQSDSSRFSFLELEEDRQEKPR